jgi:hypothetical protein
MMVGFQFSKVGEIAMPDEERGALANVGSSDFRKRSSRHSDAVSRDSKRALRRRGISGERMSQRGRNFVTSAGSVSAWLGNKVKVARRMGCFPPEPNQTLQPTRMLVTCRADARPAPSTRVADL